MFELKENPSIIEFGKAVALLDGVTRRQDLPPCSHYVAGSAIRSLNKLDGLLERVVRPGSWSARRLGSVDENGNVGLRCPKVVLHFKYDKFPARAGNLELWLNPEPGYESDFIYNIQKTKLLRVDKFWDACSEQSGHCRHIAPTREASEVVLSAGMLFNYIIQTISAVCDVTLLNKLEMDVDRKTQTLSGFKVGDDEDLD